MNVVIRRPKDWDFNKNSPSPWIFLAGPTDRDPQEQTEWREEAISLFQGAGFKGTLFCPEPFHGEYQAQIDWEERGLTLSDCIVFWVPRDLDTLPGFTTNIEFGTYMKSGRVVLGYPPGTPKMRYFDHYAEKYNIPKFSTLEDTIAAAITKANRNLPLPSDY